MVRMSKKVGRKHIIVPNKTCFDVFFHRTQVDAGKASIKDKTIECPDSDIGCKHVGGCF